MRQTFSKITDELIRKDANTVLLLGDIGVYSFKKTMADFPKRAINFGIMEQTMISFAAGLASMNFNPIVHTIAPFLVERAYEQLKVDFGYQELHGNFVSVGGSYDYATLGSSHHSPADVNLILNIPGFEIIVPGTNLEFEKAFLGRYANRKPTYYRLSETQNQESYPVNKTGGFKIKKGKLATIVAIGPVLDIVLPCTTNYDIEVIYMNQVSPFDFEIVNQNCESGKILIVEPFYIGSVVPLILEARKNKFTIIENLGVPKTFIRNYGKKSEIDHKINFTSAHLVYLLDKLIDSKFEK